MPPKAAKAAPPTEGFIVTGLVSGRNTTKHLDHGTFAKHGYPTREAMQQAIADGDWLSVMRTERKGGH